MIVVLILMPASPPPLAALFRIRLYRCVWLIVVSVFDPRRPRQLPWFIDFYPFLPPHFRLIVAYISLFLTPDTPVRNPIDCCVVIVCFCGLLLAQDLHPEVNNQLVRSPVHLWLASAVIVTAMAAESPTTTPPPVAEAFVMVLVGFGGDWAAIWRLPAMVGVVDVSFVRLKMARKERWEQKKLMVAFNVLVMVL